jgi:uncharacterized repeat protein (TIGR01451 family)/MYXO-CTERM domain-containing protein
MSRLCNAAAATLVGVGLCIGGAQAVSVNGSISFANGGLTVPAVPSTSITNQMTTITQGTPVPTACSGDFSTAPIACDLAGAVTGGTFDTGGPFGGTVYTYGGFTFQLQNVLAIDRANVLHVNDPFLPTLLSDSLNFVVAGTVSGNGFDPTPFLGVWTGQGACTGTPFPPTCTADVTASWSVSITALGNLNPQLSVAKTPDNGTFVQGAQVSFTIVVSNPAASGEGPAIDVTLTDQLPGNGGLVWSNVSTSQGSCTNPIVGNLLDCNLGNIPPQGSVTVTVTSTPPTPAAACQSQPNPVALATAFGGLTAQDAGSLTCTPAGAPQLSVVKTPDNGMFQMGSQIAFTIVVSNPAAPGSPSATNVALSDQLPGNGGLVWSNVSTSQGSCTTPIVGNLLTCSLGTIAPQGSVTVTVSSASTTPADACQFQPNPVALATADGGLTAQDGGSLDCSPLPPPPPPPGTEPIPGPGILLTALFFLLGAFLFGGWRRRR